MSALPRTHGDDEVSEETIVGPDIAIRGRIDGEEDLRVEGRVEGSISLTETLYVEPGGVVLATVDARDVVVSGIVIGDVTALNSITLNRAAKLVGNIAAPRVIIADGASFRGDVAMDHEDLQPSGRERNRATSTVPRNAITGRSTTARRATASTSSSSSSSRREVTRATPVRRAEPAPAPVAAAPKRRKDEEDDVTVVIKHASMRKGEAPPEDDDDKPARRRRAKKSARMPARGRSKTNRRKS